MQVPPIYCVTYWLVYSGSECRVWCSSLQSYIEEFSIWPIKLIFRVKNLYVCVPGRTAPRKLFKTKRQASLATVNDGGGLRQCGPTDATVRRKAVLMWENI